MKRAVRRTSGWLTNSITYPPMWILCFSCSTIRPTPVPRTRRLWAAGTRPAPPSRHWRRRWRQGRLSPVFVFSGHVHNYERHEHGGVTYFVSGGGAAHAYPIERAPDDPFQSKEVNYHYLLVEVDQQQLKVTMNRLDLTTGKAVWTQPDSVKIAVPVAAVAQVLWR